mgnify:CR=1 FL=1
MIIINKGKELIKKQKDELSPSYINLKNPRYMEIDGKYCSSLLVVDYSREQRDLIFKPLIDTNININMSIFYEEQDPYKVVKDLTYNIGNTAVDLEAGKNKQDIDIVEYTHDDAKYIRKQLQVNDEAFYYIYVYITIYNEDLKDLKINTDKIISILQSRGIKVRQAYFRQEQAFFSTLPLMINHKDVKEATKKNILTEGLVATYPFISSSICDTNGIFIGKNIYNNSLIFVDRYDQEKYKNANMCVFGTSGAGKSYYIKLNILRYRLFGIEQYVIDPEREYTGLCNKLEGTLLKLGPNSETYINVFDIRKESIEKGEKGFLANKIIKLIGFFNLVFGELDEEEKGLIEEKIIQTYEKKNINFDDKSLYKNNENNCFFRSSQKNEESARNSSYDWPEKRNHICYTYNDAQKYRIIFKSHKLETNKCKYTDNKGIKRFSGKKMTECMVSLRCNFQYSISGPFRKDCVYDFFSLCNKGFFVVKKIN